MNEVTEDIDENQKFFIDENIIQMISSQRLFF